MFLLFGFQMFEMPRRAQPHTWLPCWFSTMLQDDASHLWRQNLENSASKPWGHFLHLHHLTSPPNFFQSLANTFYNAHFTWLNSPALLHWTSQSHQDHWTYDRVRLTLPPIYPIHLFIYSTLSHWALRFIEMSIASLTWEPLLAFLSSPTSFIFCLQFHSVYILFTLLLILLCYYYLCLCFCLHFC